MLTKERLKEVLDYDPYTGVFTWRIAAGRRVRVGQRAGTDDGQGYLQIGIDRTYHKAHRLAWFYVHGQWPKKEIDHINRNRSDNRLENLREVTHQQQNFNRGAKGYCWDKMKKKWHAQITLNGKRKHLGRYDTETDARAAYLAAKKDLHSISKLNHAISASTGTQNDNSTTNENGQTLHRHDYPPAWSGFRGIFCGR